MKAWADRQNWPPAFRKLNEAFNLEAISAFATQAARFADKRYFSESAWNKLAQLQIGRPAELAKEMADRQKNLFAEVAAVMEEDPGCDRAQEVAAKWIAHFDEAAGYDAEISRGFTRSWIDRRNWPEWKLRRQPPNFEKMAFFVSKALDWPLRNYYSEAGWNRRMEHWNSITLGEWDATHERRRKIFEEIRAAWDEATSSERAKVVARHWLQMREAESAGAPEMANGLAKAWADRRNWPDALKSREANSYGMSLTDFNRAAEFIDAAVAASQRTV